MEKTDKAIVKAIKNAQAMLDKRFAEKKNPNYLDARNKLEDALVVLYNIE